MGLFRAIGRAGKAVGRAGKAVGKGIAKGVGEAADAVKPEVHVEVAPKTDEQVGRIVRIIADALESLAAWLKGGR